MASRIRRAKRATSDVELPDEPVSVRLDSDISKPIGRALLRKDGNCVYADIELAEGQSASGLVPAIAGQYIFVSKAHGRTDYGCRITHLDLCTTGNADRRICEIGLSQHEQFRRQMGLDKERFIFCSDKPMRKLLSSFWFPQLGTRPQGMTPQEFLKACGLEIYYDPSCPSDELQFGYTTNIYGCDCKVVTRKMKIGDFALPSGSPRLTA